MSTAETAQQFLDIIPGRMIGLVPLMRQAFTGIDLKPLGAQLVARAAVAPEDANALMDLSTVLQLTGHREVALATQAQALAIQPLYSVPAARPSKPVRVLVVMAPGDLMANTPVEFLVEDSDVHLDLFYVGDGVVAPARLPEHDLVFVAVGESDANQPLLSVLADLLQTWPRPVLNAPARIASLSRDGASSLLRSVAGLLMPACVRITRRILDDIGANRAAFESFSADSRFPIIIRPIGSHAGQSLQKLDRASDIKPYLQKTPEAEFYISRFVDYRSEDGLFRKYRVILIDGRPYICHMAISAHWMIHYLNAGMTENADKRAEEARFMEDFNSSFALRHQDAFRKISDRLGLDYVGLDCAETMEGQLLVFEADSDMIVHAMDPVDRFAYKQPVMARLFAGFRQMLVDTVVTSS